MLFQPHCLSQVRTLASSMSLCKIAQSRAAVFHCEVFRTVETSLTFLRQPQSASTLRAVKLPFQHLPWDLLVSPSQPQQFYDLHIGLSKKAHRSHNWYHLHFACFDMGPQIPIKIHHIKVIRNARQLDQLSFFKLTTQNLRLLKISDIARSQNLKVQK